jgi:hypothetical protein
VVVEVSSSAFKIVPGNPYFDVFSSGVELFERQGGLCSFPVFDPNETLGLGG